MNYVLRLYVGGRTPQSIKTLRHLRQVCQESLKRRYQLEVIDLYRKPRSAKVRHIIAQPAVLKKLPLRIRPLIAQLERQEHILLGIDLKRK